MIRCIAIDDESLALDLLEDNIRRTPFLKLLKSFTSGFDALEFLRQEPVELIFLDIRMPDLTGLQLLKVIQPKPLVILITAYEKYALEGFELDVVDYLLKPVPYERFLKAVTKARELILLRRAALALSTKEETAPSSGYIFVKSDYKQVRIDFSEILYIEGLKDYIKIYNGEKPVITQMSMKSISEKLPEKDFMRVHRSFIINVHRIQYVQRMHIRVGNKDIPIGENYRDQFFNAINQNQNPS
jgi:two-component system LytT family response regulator